jgi:hypothetical protein
MRYKIEIECDSSKNHYYIALYLGIRKTDTVYQMISKESESLSEMLSIVNEIPIKINKLTELFNPNLND